MDQEGRPFFSKAFLYPPMGDFEALDKPTIPSVLGRCEKLAGKWKSEFFEWLAKTTEKNEHFAFALCGGAVYGIHKPQDVDVLFFVANQEKAVFPSPYPQAAMRYPKHVHLHKIPDMRADWHFLLINSLLFTCTPPAFVYDIIKSARKETLKKPFFGGGLGDRIAYAAFKSLGTPEYHDEDGQILSSISISVEWMKIDFASMLRGPHTPVEISSQIRSQMQELDDCRLSALTRAAMRRLRIKKEKRPGIEKRFIRQLRRM